MKVRMPKKWDPLADSFILTKIEIEQQVASDLARFRTEYSAKYNEIPPSPLDVEMFISLLWGFNVVYEEMEQGDNEESLGTLRPETQEIIVDSQCTHQGRLSFTMAHEAGHLSLHGPLFRREGGKIVGWATPPEKRNKKRDDVAYSRREWQANVYAGALLAPRTEVVNLLREIGAISFFTVTSFNLDENFLKFEDRFGLSRQALEIRLDHLKLPFTGRQYIQISV